jgi:putative ATP-binding cassette transporter
MSNQSKGEAASEVRFGRELLRLFRPFWHLSLFATLMGGLAGLSTAWLLATINCQTTQSRPKKSAVKTGGSR